MPTRREFLRTAIGTAVAMPVMASLPAPVKALAALPAPVKQVETWTVTAFFPGALQDVRPLIEITRETIERLDDGWVRITRTG